MVRYCSAEICKNRNMKYSPAGASSTKEKDVSFYNFPSIPKLRQQWIQALINLNGQENALNLPKTASLCMEHFEPNCFEKIGLWPTRLKPNSVPTIFPRTKNKSQVPVQSLNETIITPSPSPSSSPSPSDEILMTPTTPNKKIRYPGDITDDILEEMTPRKLKKCVRLLKEACRKKDHIIKRLHTEKTRQKKKIKTLQELLSDLNKKNLLSSNTCNLIECLPEEKCIINEIEKGKVNGQYSPQLRSFALTLHFYSPKAYNYVREVYKNKLPAPSTIRSWYSNTNGSPGFTQEAINILKRRSDAAGEKKIYATLMMDEMAIRKQLEWSHCEKKFIGYVDCGAVISEPDNMPLAKEALVYLLTGINERWKIPVAYFYIHGLTSQERAEITLQLLRFVATSGVEVIALTFDGLLANIKMCTEFNADVYDKPYFRHPTCDHDIVIFFDAAHMLKLIRTTWASKRVLYDSDGNHIKWEFIENLVCLQEHDYFHLANKVNSKHIQWQKNKMSVKLAAQTLSQSCATALQMLMEEGHPDFLDCAPTIKFLRMVNNAFDCLNSRSLFSHGFKQPLRADTAFQTFTFFTEAIEYFSGLKLHPDGKCIIETKSKTGFLGFIIDMKNLKKIYQEYVETRCLKYILTYKFSQDHLEIFFSCIRTMGGYNNNPNCIQFASAYKRLLHHNEVKSSAAANCLPLDNTNILTISSTKKIKKSPKELDEEDIEDIMVDDIPLQLINSTVHHAVLYISGFIEMRMLKKITCETCIQLVNESKEANSIFIKTKSLGNLRYPRQDTYFITTVAEKVFNIYRIDNKLQTKNVLQKMTVNVMRNLELNSIFKNFNEHVLDNDILENHKYDIIKTIIELYLKVKLYYFGKEFTRKSHLTYIRKDLTKIILFKGQ